MPAPQKLPSGRARDSLLLAIAKLTDVSARQLSKANGVICAPGDNALVASLPKPILLSEQHFAKTLRPNWTHPGAAICRSA